MKLALISFLALALSQGISAAPADAATAEVASRDRDLEKRAVQAVVTADALRYRTCPRVDPSCPSMGQYSRGTTVTVECFTSHGTTPVEGNPRWARLGNGYWASLFYLNANGGISPC